MIHRFDIVDRTNVCGKEGKSTSYDDEVTCLECLKIEEREWRRQSEEFKGQPKENANYMLKKIIDRINFLKKDAKVDLCEYCGGDKKIRNPTGKCDHLYYPESVNTNYPNKKGCGKTIKLHPKVKAKCGDYVMSWDKYVYCEECDKVDKSEYCSECGVSPLGGNFGDCKQCKKEREEQNPSESTDDKIKKELDKDYDN